MSDNGGEPELIYSFSSGFFLNFVSLLPGGGALIGNAYHFQDRSLAGIFLLDLETDSLRVLIPGQYFRAQYLESGYLLYADREGRLSASSFDVRSREVSGATALLDGLDVVNGPPGLAAFYSVSGSGTLVYFARGAGEASGGAQELLVVDLEGHEETVPLGPRLFRYPQWSPDGASIAYAGSFDRWLSIFTYDVELRTTPRRLTGISSQLVPIWSPDGSHIAYRDNATSALSVESVDDDAPPRVLLREARREELIPTQWPRDDLLLFERRVGESDPRGDLWTLDMAGDSAVARPYLESEADLRGVKVSPDGTLAAYSSDESGQREVYVRGFPRATQPEMVSAGGGTDPVFWSPGGDIVYYWVQADAGMASLVAASVDRGSPFTVVTRDTVLTGRYDPIDTDLNPDGDRLVAARTLAAPDSVAGGGGALRRGRELARRAPRADGWGVGVWCCAGSLGGEVWQTSRCGSCQHFANGWGEPTATVGHEMQRAQLKTPRPATGNRNPRQPGCLPTQARTEREL